MRALLVLLLLAACTAPTPPPPPPSTTPSRIAGKAEFPPPEAMIGVSGLALRPGGTFYAVSEREPTLFPIEIGPEGQPKAKAPLEIRGKPDGLDLEAMTFLDANTVAFGTESDDEARTEDAILYAAIADDGVTILDERTRAFFPYAPFGIGPEGNRGIEGLCSIDAKLIAASEQVFEKDGRRHAPLGVYDPLTKSWASHAVVLTSEAGKISALACAGGPAHAEVWAIERHYETVRVIRFDVPLGAQAMQTIEATLVEDLGPTLGPKPKNYEGLAAAPGGGLYLISDNSYGRLDGPTTLLLFVPQTTSAVPAVAP